MNDPAIGKVICWKIKSSIRPERDLVAGESPFARHLWLTRDYMGSFNISWMEFYLSSGYLVKVRNHTFS